ncbi:AAA family ATPase [Bacillus smithii]|uniref:deoxynucleotide monophosphate kinase family protein n=1 Tax=Bacillus smithii TaxID=1479 RepID=UPI002E1C6F89|nr:AAA family ATPase [Bacillus smithii]MED4928855.1 AAA family ATPase [Bacillus smithii]
MSNVHLIKDESLGGVLREYIEVDREANVGEYVYVFGHIHDSANGIFKIKSIENDCGRRLIKYAQDFGTTYKDGKAYRTLEPTDIIQIDGKRYRMVDRKAIVGEKIIITSVDTIDNDAKLGEIRTVSFVFDTTVDTVEGKYETFHYEYQVLEPIDQQQNEDNHSQRKIEQLENELFSIKKDFETWAQEFENFKNKLKKYNNTLKIAVCGNFRAGKDTVADYLVEKYFFKKFAFADKLKDTLHRLFPDIPRVPKPRHPYQVFGEGVCDLDIPGAKTVWIDACLRSIDNYIKQCAELHKECKNIVITDLRKPIEYERLRKENYIIIRVTASEEVRLQRAKKAGDKYSKADLFHNTESYVDQFDVDFEIENNGTIEELERKVDEVMLKIIKNRR